MTIIMVMAMRYELVYAAAAFSHLSGIARAYHSAIRRAIGQQLGYEPDVRTINRRLLLKRSRFGEAWELRCGPNNRFRVFYRIEEETARVRILAIGQKIREKLYIGGEEFEK